MKLQKFDTLHEKVESFSRVSGNLLVDAFQYLALFAIGGAIVWAAVYAFSAMVANGRATIGDILLLFIYLELGAMVWLGVRRKTAVHGLWFTDHECTANRNNPCPVGRLAVRTLPCHRGGWGGNV